MTSLHPERHFFLAESIMRSCIPCSDSKVEYKYAQVLQCYAASLKGNHDKRANGSGVDICGVDAVRICVLTAFHTH
jgi:hypothetical protein